MRRMRVDLACLATGLVVLLTAGLAPAETVTAGGRTYERLSGGSVVYSSGSGTFEIIPDRMTIVPLPSLTAAQKETLLGELELGVDHIGAGGKYFDLVVPSGSDPLEVVQRCYADSRVVDAWPDTKAKPLATPSDYYFSTHDDWWRQWNLKRLGAEDAWEIETGDTNVVIALIDVGIELDHEDLKGNLWVNWAEYNGVDDFDDDLNGYEDDVYGANTYYDNGDINVLGHGTKVAGLMAAQTNNDGTGVAGLAGGWYDETWSSGERGSGCLIMTAGYPELSSSLLLEALEYAVDNGADVANMSFEMAEVGTTAWREVIDKAAAAGMTLVGAAGNENNEDVGYPAAFTRVIAVGASDVRDSLTWWSTSGPELDVLAPSGACAAQYNSCGPTCVGNYSAPYLCPQPYPDPDCVCDSLFLWTTHDMESTGYDFFSGTSGASPQVAAIAGLLESFDPSLSRHDVRDLIRSSAEDSLSTGEQRGHDARHGYGRVNAYQALFLARGGGATTSDLRLCYDVEFDRDVKVSSGTTLTILPGVTVEFTAGSDAANLGVDATRCELIVEGTLIAQGRGENTPVVFTSSGSSAGDWYGIRAPADKGSIDLRYCAIGNAYKGVAVDNPDALELSQLDIDDCVAHGIYCENCDSSAKVDSCTLTDPGLVGIEARDCTGLTLQGHSITDAMDYGIKCYDVADMTVKDNYVLGDSSSVDFVGVRVKPVADTSHYSIEGNTIERCSSRGIWCAKGVGDDATVEGNCVSDSDYTRGGTGVYFYYSSAKMRQTTAEKKTHGVVATCGTVSGTFWKPDLGDSTGLGEDGDNRFIDNSLYYIWTTGLGGSTVKAERNWHGTSPPSRSKFYGSIDYVPYLTSDPGSYPRLFPGEVGQPKLTLAQNRPNPFNPVTSISFSVPRAGPVTLRIYDAAGRLVRTLVNEHMEPGEQSVAWDGRDDRGLAVASGVYFARLRGSSDVEVMKLVLLK